MSGPEKESIFKGIKIKGKGVFDLEDFYLELYRWFEHYGYSWKELRYKNIDNPDGSKMIEFQWKCERKLHEYYNVEVTMDFQIMAKDVEITIENKKLTRQKGSIELISDATLLKQTQKFEKAIFKKRVTKAYEYLLKDTLDYHEDEAIEEVTKLYDEIKAFIGMI